jgi:Raf kinase inhibitor-like YbhB/YbcL family protein
MFKIDVISLKSDLKTLEITSPSFTHLGLIPITYSCEGNNINPPLTIEKIPETTKSLVLIVDDPDSPGRVWTHWVVWNIPPIKKISENSVPGIEGVNDFCRLRYDGPCPPSEVHHYHFKVYALNELLQIPSHSRKQDVEKAMTPYLVAFGEIIGLYERIFI